MIWRCVRIGKPKVTLQVSPAGSRCCLISSRRCLQLPGSALHLGWLKVWCKHLPMMFQVLYIGKICCNIVYHCLVCSTCCMCSEARQKGNNQRCATWHGEGDASLMHFLSRLDLQKALRCRSTDTDSIRFKDVKLCGAFHGADRKDPQAGVLPVKTLGEGGKGERRTRPASPMQMISDIANSR